MKQALMIELNQHDTTSFDTLLFDLGIDPDKEELTSEEAEKVRAHFRDSQMALPSNGKAPSDDDVLALAEGSGVDLDVVMDAADALGELEALVKWVETYQSCVTDAEIEADAKRQFQIDQLERKEKELGERLAAAVNLKSPDFDAIRRRLGITTPEAVTRLADKEREPNFLKSARVAMKIRRGVTCDF